MLLKLCVTLNFCRIILDSLTVSETGSLLLNTKRHNYHLGIIICSMYFTRTGHFKLYGKD